MKLTPAKLLVICPAVILAGLLVGRRPEPSGTLFAPETAVVIPRALAASWPEVVPLRFAAKQQLAREVAAGRRPLLEAAALFRELNRLPPETATLPPPVPIGLPLRIPLDTEEGRLCRLVVKYVYVSLCDEVPSQANEALTRLEAEFFAELQARGAIRLPDPSSLEPATALLGRVKGALTDAQRQSLFGTRRADD